MWEQIIGGAVSAAFYGFTAFKKSKGNEEFQPAKMVPVVVLGAIVGGVAGYSNLDYNVVVNASWTGFVAVAVENVWKWLWRSWLSEWWDRQIKTSIF